MFSTIPAGGGSTPAIRDISAVSFLSDVLGRRESTGTRKVPSSSCPDAGRSEWNATSMPGYRLQPIVDLQTSGTLGCELLAGDRCCPDWGDVEWRAWYARLDQMLSARTPPDLVFVNVDAAQLCDPAIVDNLERAVLSGSCVIEWTERFASAQQTDQAVAALRRLAARGVPIAIDDVGEGIDGIGRALLVLPRYAKLSASLVRRGRDGDAIGLLRHVNDLFAGMGCAVIAEGIETPEDAARCRTAGIRYGQGSHFGLGHLVD